MYNVIFWGAFLVIAFLSIALATCLTHPLSKHFENRPLSSVVDIVLLPVIALTLMACITHFLPAYTPVVKMKNTSGQQLVFVGVQHVATEEYYEAVNALVTSLRNKEFTVLHEGIGSSGDVSITLKSCATSKVAASSWGVVVQPTCLGELHAGDVYADITQEEFSSLYTDFFQAELGVSEDEAKSLVVDKVIEIHKNRDSLLNDFTSYLGLKIASLKVTLYYWSIDSDIEPREEENPVIMTARNIKLAQYISSRKNAATIYGLDHLPGVIKELRKNDSTWSVEIVDRIRVL